VVPPIYHAAGLLIVKGSWNPVFNGPDAKIVREHMTFCTINGFYPFMVNGEVKDTGDITLGQS